MPKMLNKTRLKAFLSRRKSNSLGLIIITGASALITLICALTNYKRTEVLVFVTVFLIILCLIQAYKNKKAFRTMKSSKSFHKKKSSSNSI